MLANDISRCRAELPSTATPDNPIRCSKRNECARYLAPLGEYTPLANWVCDGNRFDAFVPVVPLVKG